LDIPTVECTAFSIGNTELKGSFWITSGHCLYARSSETMPNVEMEIIVPSGRTIDLNFGQFKFHPHYLKKIQEDSHYDHPDYDLSGYFDKHDESGAGFILDEKSFEDTKTLEILGYENLEPQDLSRLWRSTAAGIQWNPRHITYESGAKYGGCYTTGSPLFRETPQTDAESKYQVYGVNQDAKISSDQRLMTCHEYAVDCWTSEDEFFSSGNKLSCPPIQECCFHASRVDKDLIIWKGPNSGVEWGDPHFTTFDGLEFDIYRACTFRLLAVPDIGIDILGKFHMPPRSRMKTVTVEWTTSKGSVFHFRFGPKSHWEVFLVNGIKRNDLTARFKETYLGQKELFELFMSKTGSSPDEYTWELKGMTLVLKLHSLEVEMKVVLIPVLLHNIYGLYGNSNGDPSDDCKKSNFEDTEPCENRAGYGEDAAEEVYQQFVSSWRVGDESTCTDDHDDYLFAQDSETVEEKMVLNQTGLTCDALQNSKFSCAAADDRYGFQQSCLVDAEFVCNWKDTCYTNMVCDAIEKMLDKFCLNNVDVANWRDDYLQCKPQCPSDQQFNPLSDPCTAICGFRKDANCKSSVYIAQCECTDSQKFLNSKNECVEC